MSAPGGTSPATSAAAGLPTRADDVIADLVDHVAELVVVFDGTGHVITVNGAIRRMLGREPDEWIGLHGTDVCHPDDLRRGIEPFISSQARGDGVEEPVRCRLSHANGSWIDAECISTSVMLADGSQVLVLSCRPKGCAGPNEVIFDGADARLSDIFEQSTLGMAQVGLDGRIIRCNSGLGLICNRTGADLHGRHLAELVTAQDRHLLAGDASALLSGRGGCIDRVALEVPDGDDDRETVVRLSSILVEDHRGQPTYYALQVVDLSEVVAAERTVRDREAQLRTILEMAEEGIVALDRHGRILYANPRFAELVRLSIAELIGAPVTGVLPMVSRAGRPQPTTRSEHLLRRHDDSRIWVRISRRSGIWSDMTDTVEQVLMVTDVSDIKAAEAELVHRSTHDPLTGLANRALLEEWIAAQPTGLRGAVVFIDLDGFKEVNDTFGHAVGDELLAVVADRLAAHSRAGDMVARLGGDEFIVACVDIDAEDASMSAWRLIDAIGEPALIGDRIHVIGASAGVATGGAFTGHLGLLQRADNALYRAKAAGGLRVVVDVTDDGTSVDDPPPSTERAQAG